MSTDHHRARDLLGAYALDALDDDERAVIERHLEECPRCRQEIDGYREVAAALGHAVEPLPPGLWDDIAAGLAAGPRRQPGLAALESPEERAPDRATATRPPRWRRPAWAAAAAAVAAVAAAVAVLGLSLAHTDQELTASRQALGSTRQAAEHAMTVSGHHVVRLDSADGREWAEVVLVPGGRGYVLARAMPSLPAGRTYQLWAIVGGTPISLGLLGPHPAAAAFSLGSARPSALAVSVEPSGGSVAPTSTPVAAGAV